MTNAQYDQIGEQFLRAQKEFYNPRNDWARDWIRRQVPPNPSTILDLGCGDGQDMLAYLADGHDVYGIDESAFMIARAKENGVAQDRLQCISMEDVMWNMKPQVIDHVSARYSLHYVPGLMCVSRNVREVLKPGGTWAFVVPNPVTDVPFSDTRNYNTAQEVNLRIFNDQVPITYAFHRLEDYLGEPILEAFRLKRFESYVEPALGDAKLPTALGIVFERR